MKKLIIIHGVTGAIGSSCLAHFASQKDIIVYGLSRKAKDFKEFCIDGKLPVATLICSISSETYPPRMATYFAQAIQSEMFSEIYYIHAVGVYPFEIDKDGNHTVTHDNDADGINDRCKELTRLFGTFYSKFSSVTKKSSRSFIFGSIADRYEPLVHRSWWKSMDELKESINKQLKHWYTKKDTLKEKPVVSVINIASILCPNELITRPFVFSATDSNPQYWLLPSDVAKYVDSLIKKGQKSRFKEYCLFKKFPGFNESYYADENFTPRKVKELFGNVI